MMYNKKVYVTTCFPLKIVHKTFRNNYVTLELYFLHYRAEDVKQIFGGVCGEDEAEDEAEDEPYIESNGYPANTPFFIALVKPF